MTLLVPWLVFPALCACLATGCALLLERVARVAIPGTLLLPLGVAFMSLVAGFATLSDATAELAVPAVVALAVLGFGSTPGRARARSPSSSSSAPRCSRPARRRSPATSRSTTRRPSSRSSTGRSSMAATSTVSPRRRTRRRSR